MKSCGSSASYSVSKQINEVHDLAVTHESEHDSTKTLNKRVYSFQHNADFEYLMNSIFFHIIH